MYTSAIWRNDIVDLLGAEGAGAIQQSADDARDVLLQHISTEYAEGAVSPLLGNHEFMLVSFGYGCYLALLSLVAKHESGLIGNIPLVVSLRNILTQLQAQARTSRNIPVKPEAIFGIIPDMPKDVSKAIHTYERSQAYAAREAAKAAAEEDKAIDAEEEAQRQALTEEYMKRPPIIYSEALKSIELPDDMITQLCNELVQTLGHAFITSLRDPDAGNVFPAKVAAQAAIEDILLRHYAQIMGRDSTPDPDGERAKTLLGVIQLAGGQIYQSLEPNQDVGVTEPQEGGRRPLYRTRFAPAPPKARRTRRVRKSRRARRTRKTPQV
jgi:hypothetical protein